MLPSSLKKYPFSPDHENPWGPHEHDDFMNMMTSCCSGSFRPKPFRPGTPDDSAHFSIRDSSSQFSGTARPIFGEIYCYILFMCIETANDTALYLTIEGENDSAALQHDLDKLSMWERDFDMEFNPSKCQVIRVTGSRNPINATYRLRVLVLETVSCARYLGVDISSDLTWRSHVDRITGSATKTLNFGRRNIKTKHPGVREMAYTLVWQQLEYAAAVWDPHTKGKTLQVEKVQRRAARWVSCNYVRLAIETLGWRSLACLCLFYKIIHGLVAAPLPSYIQLNTRISRYCHSMTFRQLHTTTDNNKHSFSPLAVVQWNALPESAVCLPSIEALKAAVSGLKHSRPYT